MLGTRLREMFLIALLLGAAVLSFYIFKPFLIPLALAAIFAVVLYPLYTLMLRAMPRWRGLAAFLTVFVGLVCIIVPLTLLSAQVVAEARQFYTSLEMGGSDRMLERALTGATTLLSPYVPGVDALAESVRSNARAYAQAGAGWVAAHLGAAFAGVASVLLALFIFLLGLFYFLRDGEEFKRSVMRISPLAAADEELVFTRLALAVNAVVRGNLLTALVQGILSTIGFTIFGLPNPLLWGVAAFFAALIPGIGTALVFIPAVAFMFFAGEAGAALGLVLWGAVAVGLVDNVLGPHLVGGRLNLHPFLMLPTVLGGVALFGPAGIFLGPLTISLLVALISLYHERAVLASSTV